MVAVARPNGTFQPDEVVAKVRALALQGYVSPKIAELTNIPARTVREWLQAPDFKDLQESHRHSVSTLAGDMLLQDLQANQENRTLSTMQLATVWGIAQDKQIAAARNATPSVNIGTFVIVTNATQAPDTIDADYSVLPDSNPTS